jgi:Flp pilus assembly protein TadG
MRHPFWSIHRDERGATLAFVAVIIFVLLGVLALSVDFGALFVDRRRMVNAADAAALAAALTYAKNDAACGTNDGPAQTQANSLATANTPSAQPGDSNGQNAYVVDCAKKTVTVQYNLTHQYLFAGAIGFDSTPVVAKATGHWGPAGGAGGVLPVMVSSGKLSNCDIPNPTGNTDCYFYVNNGGAGYGTASWALLNVQPDCGQGQFGWDVSVARCAQKVSNPNPTYNCPSWGDSALRDLILNGSPPLTVDPSGNTYVCLVKGQHVPTFVDIQGLVGKTRLFPVNDPNGQIKSGGGLCPPPNCNPDFWDIIGFIQMKILEVLKGGPNSNWPAQCTALGPPDSNAWCLHATWLGYSPVPGPICDTCQDFGVEAIGLRG